MKNRKNRKKSGEKEDKQGEGSYFHKYSKLLKTKYKQKIRYKLTNTCCQQNVSFTFDTIILCTEVIISKHFVIDVKSILLIALIIWAL